jgi:hypothetical protein
MWSRNRGVLNDFVCAARQFYIDSPIPPRKADPDEDRACTLLLFCRISTYFVYLLSLVPWWGHTFNKETGRMIGYSHTWSVQHCIAIEMASNHVPAQRSENVLNDVMEFSITTKQSDVGWGTGPNDAVRFRPAENVQQMFQYHSTRTGKKTWLQVSLSYGYSQYNAPVCKSFEMLFRALRATPASLRIQEEPSKSRLSFYFCAFSVLRNCRM